MPPVDVAPIYSDPWTQQHYEGMARLIEAVPDTADKTINAITCRFYCIRFFYTEVNRRRWVEVSAIVTWQDTRDVHLPISGAYTEIQPIHGRTVYRVESAPGAGNIKLAYLDCCPIGIDVKILGMGCTYAITTASDAVSNVTLQLLVHMSTNPAAAQTVLKQAVQSNQTNTFVLWYQALDSDRVVVAGDSFAMRISMLSVDGPGGLGDTFVKAPFLRLERTI